MGGSTGLTLTTDGRLVVVKRSASAGERLRREAEVLRRAAHPGVVELISVGGDADEISLVTAFVGGGTLDLSPGGRRDDLGGRIRLLAALATTLADLHERGVAHRRVSPDHVLAGATGHPVLCGLSQATLPPDPETEIEEGRRTDVLALGALVQEAAKGTTTKEAKALDGLGQRARALDPAVRPSMRSLALALTDLAPGPSTPRAVPPESTPVGRRLLPTAPAGRSRWRRPTLALIPVTVLVVTGVAVAGMRSGRVPPTTAPDTEPPSLAVPATTTTSPPAPSPPARVWPRDSCEPVPAPVADVDGDGCGDRLTIDDGVVTAAGVRWRVAGPDDLVVVGRWACDGRATPAVVRPGSGDIWIYPGWAADGETLVAERAGSVSGAAAVTALPRPGAGGAGCDDLEVTDASGASTVVSAGAERPRWPATARRP